jgi:hypothetical protein
MQRVKSSTHPTYGVSRLQWQGLGAPFLRPSKAVALRAPIGLDGWIDTSAGVYLLDSAIQAAMTLRPEAAAVLGDALALPRRRGEPDVPAPPPATFRRLALLSRPLP